MDIWIIVIICIVSFLILQSLSIFFNNKVLRYISFFVQACQLILLFLLEATLTHLFVFMLSTVVMTFVFLDIWMKKKASDDV